MFLFHLFSVFNSSYLVFTCHSKEALNFLEPDKEQAALTSPLFNCDFHRKILS